RRGGGWETGIDQDHGGRSRSRARPRPPVGHGHGHDEGRSTEALASRLPRTTRASLVDDDLDVVDDVGVDVTLDGDGDGDVYATV
ncbi:MAG: hypothetical protein KA297_15135, partial [Kofleriaceae bacterium]|nr:hypothetical protein [Kofleriaceae bacterium]